MIDLSTVTHQERQALRRLKEPGNEAVVWLLGRVSDQVKTKLVHAGDMGLIHRLQGRAEMIEDLLWLIETSATAPQK